MKPVTEAQLRLIKELAEETGTTLYEYPNTQDGASKKDRPPDPPKAEPENEQMEEAVTDDTLYLEPDEDGMYAWQDETGYQYYGTSDELDAWAAEAGYVDVPPAPHTPDTDNGYGLRERDLWSDDQTERARFREAAFKRMLDERTNG